MVIMSSLITISPMIHLLISCVAWLMGNSMGGSCKNVGNTTHDCCSDPPTIRNGWFTNPCMGRVTCESLSCWNAHCLHVVLPVASLVAYTMHINMVLMHRQPWQFRSLYVSRIHDRHVESPSAFHGQSNRWINGLHTMQNSISLIHPWIALCGHMVIQ